MTIGTQAGATKSLVRSVAGRIRTARAGVDLVMLDPWLQDLESLEAISQDDDTKRIFLRMAMLSQNGQLGSFLNELERDQDIDDVTKGTLAELALDRSFLLAVETYLRATQRLH